MYKKWFLGMNLVLLFLVLLLVRGSNLLKTNFSVLANREGSRGIFHLWGIILGNFSYLTVKELFLEAECEDCWMDFFLTVSLFLLMLGIGIPYQPKKVWILSRLHVCFSFLAPVCFEISQLRFLYLLEQKWRGQWKKIWLWQAGLLMMVCGLLFLCGMVTSLLEIVLTEGVCLYLFIVKSVLSHRNFHKSFYKT